MPDPLEPSFEITFLTENPKETFPWQKRLEALGKRLLQEENCLSNVNVVLCSDKTVRELNRDYRHLDKVTDVLSFEWHEPYLLGEIYIAKEQVKRQAPQYGNTFYDELKRVFVHGLFHLCGYDHIKPKDRVKMRRRECEFLKINYYRENNG
ncbi:MAG: rRNA maturation RNase YbeY [Fibrobacteraceae bacterium]|jgi:probable rRNA maturation factor|nr:rRNA maturation RNase YbeY [Fibrobacteraceae bacterium]MBQ5610829.1 rRNA maturation RNase YbeY [Fibrobacteraceae bacterium]